MKKNIIEWFGLRGVIFDTMEIKDHVYLKIRCARVWARCPACCTSTRKQHDTSIRKKSHDVSDKRRVYILVTVRRFYCRKCQKPFTEYLPEWLNGKHRYTQHFETVISESLISKSFYEVSRIYGVSTPTLLSILKRRAQNIKIPDGDLILNVDEHSFSGRDLKISIGIPNHRKLLAVLNDDNQMTLEKYFESWPDEARNRVLEVCIDMKQSYLTVLKRILPKADIVIDRFHVMKEMCRQVEEMRKIIQGDNPKGIYRINRFLMLKNRDKLTLLQKKKLEESFNIYRKHPTLKEVYFVKEKVREMYECKTRKEAERKLNMLLSQLEYYEVGKLKEMRDTLIRWKPYILNFFTRRTTNAFIEGCHNRIKLIKRISYGFRNFENYVLKITLAFLPFLFLNSPQ
jgi:transposase